MNQVFGGLEMQSSLVYNIEHKDKEVSFCSNFIEKLKKRKIKTVQEFGWNNGYWQTEVMHIWIDFKYSDMHEKSNK